MSLLTKITPIENFIRSTEKYLESKNLSDAIVLDDTRTGLRIWANINLKDESFQVLLANFGKALKDKDIDTLTGLYKQIKTVLDGFKD